MHDVTSPRNRDNVRLELEVDNPAMIGQLLAAGDVKAQQVLARQWLGVGFAACNYAGTVMDTSMVQHAFAQFQRDFVTLAQSEIVDKIQRDFSLENSDGILAHLVKVIQQGNGELVGGLDKGNAARQEGLDQRITALSRQFSADYPDSAVSKLIRTVAEGSTKIAGQLTLDDPNSPLSRMQGTVVKLLETQNTRGQEFQQNVTTTLSTGLAAFTARREAEAKSTLHGLTFQDRALECLADLAGRRGHVFDDVSARPGLISRCKSGDGVLKVGPKYLAKNAVIVFEAKDMKGYSVRNMLTEIEEARKNRGASFGVFVMSVAHAPAGMAPLTHYGDDIIVAWDADNPATNICLDAALEMACGLATRQAAAKGQSIDFTIIDRTINSIEKKATGLGQIFISATTIRNAADKILDESKPKHAALIEELASLRGHIAALRGSAGAPTSDSIVSVSTPF